MATEIISTIGSDPGDDYSTLNAWWAAKKGNIVAADQIQIAELRGETHTFASLMMTTTDATVDSSHYYHIRPMSTANWFSGDLDNTTNVPFLKNSAAQPGTVLGGNLAYTRYEGFMSGDMTSSGAVMPINADMAASIYINRIGVRNISVNASDGGVNLFIINAGENAVITNCVISGISGTINMSGKTVNVFGIGLTLLGLTKYSCYNCTVGNLTATHTGTGVNNVAQARCFSLDTAINCLGFNTSASCPSGSAAATDIYATIQSYNASKDTTAVGTGCITGITPTNEITDASATTLDCHLLWDARCRRAGTSLATTFTDDVNGNQRRKVWDIGADGYLTLTASRGDDSSLKTDATDEENAFTNLEYQNISLDDDVFVEQTAIYPQYSVYVFKNKYKINTPVTATWKGKTNIAPSYSIVKLQVWNNNSSAWEDLDSDNATAANTEFTLTGDITTNLNYYYSSNWVTYRVWQESKI